MAVFGLPRLHEDDALRAVRAAVEMREALEVINERARAGLRRPSGEPHRGQYRRGRLRRHHHRPAARDRRHRQRCRPAGAVGALLRGADRATDVRAGARRRRGRAGRAARAQGQGRTRSRLPAPACRARARARASRRSPAGRPGRASSWNCRRCSTRSGETGRPQLATVVAPAGTGKSRLLHGFLDGRGRERTSLSGRCLPYGEGITYWPIAEAVRGLAQVMQDDPADVASERVLALFADIPDAGKRVASAIGLTEDAFPAEEIAWAVRRAHRGARRRGPADRGARRHPLGGADAARPRAGPGGVGRGSRFCSCAARVGISSTSIRAGRRPVRAHG